MCSNIWRNTFKIMTWWTDTYICMYQEQSFMNCSCLHGAIFLFSIVSLLFIAGVIIQNLFCYLWLDWHPFSWKYWVTKIYMLFKHTQNYLQTFRIPHTMSSIWYSSCSPSVLPLLKQRWLWRLFLLSQSHLIHPSAFLLPFLYLAFSFFLPDLEKSNTFPFQG